MITLDENQALIALKCTSKTLNRKKQDLRRTERKLANLRVNGITGLAKLRKSILERKSVILELESFELFLKLKLEIE